MKTALSLIFRTTRACAGEGGRVAVLMSLSHAAHAHHAMGGRTPSTLFEGLLSGLAHPVIGLDHFAFVVAIGLLAIGARSRLAVPALFVAMTLLGTALHLMRVDVAAVEALVALSVLAAGALLATNRLQPLALLLPLAALAGLLHGYAYGESIVGAESTPLVAYLIGFGLVQFAIASGARWLGGRLLAAADGAAALRVRRASAGAVCAIGMLYLGLAIYAA
jgi:urease accessory protein